MRKVIVESPYAGNVDENVTYARLALHDSLMKNEAPFASHLLYTQEGVLDDTVPAERSRGIEAGLHWGSLADATAVYYDRGISSGMHYGIGKALIESRYIDYRRLSGYKESKCEFALVEPYSLEILDGEKYQHAYNLVQEAAINDRFMSSMEEEYFLNFIRHENTSFRTDGKRITSIKLDPESHGFLHGIYEGEKLVAFSTVEFSFSVVDSRVTDFLAEHQEVQGVDFSDVGQYALLDACVVDPAYRGRGMQKLLIGRRLAYAKQVGCSHVFASVHPENYPSLANMLDAGLRIVASRYTGAPNYASPRYLLAKQI